MKNRKPRRQMIIRTVISLLVCLQLMFLGTSSAVSQSLGMPAGKWWYNFPSSPLKFEPTNEDASMLDLKRDSLPGEKILGYRLGCLVKNDGRIQITKRLALKELNLASDHNYFSSASEFRFDIRACTEKNPVLGVVEVRFADGGVWTVPTAPDVATAKPGPLSHGSDCQHPLSGGELVQHRAAMKYVNEHGERELNCAGER